VGRRTTTSGHTLIKTTPNFRYRNCNGDYPNTFFNHSLIGTTMMVS
jgi:hypothetical protein